MSRPPMLLLAGTSEAGKSTAGVHLAARGAHRVKIRTILTALTSGVPAIHEGVAMREGFDHGEFVQHVLTLPAPASCRAVVIESFIDPDLAVATRTAWPAACAIVFITATRSHRLHRLATDLSLDADRAAELLDGKDGRKHVTEHLERWRTIADHWIDNDGTREAYLARLDQLLSTGLTPEGPA